MILTFRKVYRCDSESLRSLHIDEEWFLPVTWSTFIDDFMLLLDFRDSWDSEWKNVNFSQITTENSKSLNGLKNNILLNSSDLDRKSLVLPISERVERFTTLLCRIVGSRLSRFFARCGSFRFFSVKGFISYYLNFDFESIMFKSMCFWIFEI